MSNEYERYVVSDFVPDMIPNELELFDILEEMSLQDLSKLPDDEEHPYYHNYSMVSIYVLNQEHKEGNVLGLTTDELNERVNTLIVDHTLTRLAQKGLVDVRVDDDGEMSYGLTPDGKNQAAIILGEQQ